MSKEEDREELKQEILKNWWIIDKADLYMFVVIFCFNVMIGLALELSVGKALFIALISCLVWIPVGHILSYLFIKKWG